MVDDATTLEESRIAMSARGPEGMSQAEGQAAGTEPASFRLPRVHVWHIKARTASLPWCSGGANGSGGADITLAIVVSSSGAASASATKSAITSAVADSISSACRRPLDRPAAAGTEGELRRQIATTPSPPPRIAQNNRSATWHQPIDCVEIALGSAGQTTTVALQLMDLVRIRLRAGLHCVSHTAKCGMPFSVEMATSSAVRPDLASCCQRSQASDGNLSALGIRLESGVFGRIDAVK